MLLRKLALAAVAAAALIPAAASAQSFSFGYGPPTPRALFVEDRGYGYGDPLQMREDHLRDWMRRGSQEGWLNGWRAERAWGEFRAIRDESFAGDYARHDAWRRLDRLSDFVRWAHDNAGY